MPDRKQPTPSPYPKVWNAMSVLVCGVLTIPFVAWRFDEQSSFHLPHGDSESSVITPLICISVSTMLSRNDYAHATSFS